MPGKSNGLFSHSCVAVAAKVCEIVPTTDHSAVAPFGKLEESPSNSTVSVPTPVAIFALRSTENFSPPVGTTARLPAVVNAVQVFATGVAASFVWLVSVAMASSTPCAPAPCAAVAKAQNQRPRLAAISVPPDDAVHILIRQHVRVRDDVRCPSVRRRGGRP